MAGDWIKFDHDFPEKEEVVGICARTGVSVAETMYCLFRLWRWADKHTTDGRLRNVSVTGVTLVCGGSDAFWAAVVDVGWLIEDGNDVVIPEFEARFGASARRRLLSAKRMQHMRYKRNASVTGASRAGNPVSVSVSDVSAKADTPLPPFAELKTAWNLTPGVRRCIADSKKRTATFRTRLGEPLFRDNWREALKRFPLRCFASEPGGWQPDLDWFLRPGTVGKILEGAYDWEKQSNGQQHSQPQTREWINPADYRSDKP